MVPSLPGVRGLLAGSEGGEGTSVPVCGSKFALCDGDLTSCSWGHISLFLWEV